MFFNLVLLYGAVYKGHLACHENNYSNKQAGKDRGNQTHVFALGTTTTICSPTENCVAEKVREFQSN